MLTLTIHSLVWWFFFDFSIQRHSCYTRISWTSPSLPKLFYLEKILWEYGWLTEGKGTAVFLRTECGRISLWPYFRRLCCYFLLNAAMPQMSLFLVREKSLFTELLELLPAPFHSSGQPQSVHNPAFYLMQGCQCKNDVSRWEGVGADCSTCQIYTSHLKRSWFLECLHQVQTIN